MLSDVTFLYKALHGIINIDLDVEPNVDFYRETDHYSFSDKLTLKIRYAATNVLKYTSFIELREHGTPFPFPFVRQQV